MNRQEILERQKKMKEFHNTKLGHAFRKFENAHSLAWQFDGREEFPSAARERKVWDNEKAAREALLDILMPLALEDET